MTDASRYVDLQLNGYAGVDFNADDLSTEQVAEVCRRLRSDGVECVLATVITDEVDIMCRRLQNIRDVRDQDPLIAEVIRGIHIEGPFINEQPGYVGAHPKSAVRPADVDSMNRLLDAAGNLVRIVTLAPERDPEFRVTRLLADMEIRVSAGHCDPSLAELQAAIDAGLSMFTHLGNGCPLVMHRHDNIIQRVLSVSDRLRIGFIADGVHVPLPVLGNYLRVTGVERAFVVTDAIQAAGLDPGNYRLGTQEVVVDDQLATWAADRSHLVGSACTMPIMERNLRDRLGLAPEQVRRLVYDNPRAAIGL
jgi:N-acetylglucosamine-6-phosphate deacetylase